MYTPHKQNTIQNELEIIQSLIRFKNYVDKHEVKVVLQLSEKTIERRLKQLNLKHMNNNLIQCLIDYEQGVSTKTLSNRLGCSEVNVNALAKRNNVQRPVGYLNKLKSDFEFFDKIDTEEKAYILGFFAADGCITDYEFKFGISSKDLDILQKIKTCMKSEVDIKTKQTLCSLTNKETSVSIFSISSQYLVKSIQAYGFTSQKTNDCSFPSIPDDLCLHFIRGYFDGDGSLSKYVTDTYTKYSINICGTESFLNHIKNYIEGKYPIQFNSKLTKRFNTQNCCYSLNMSGQQNCIQFLSLLYEDSSIYLDRKYNKYKSFIE